MAIVYIHKRLDNNEIFYIGISKNERRAFERGITRRNIMWKRIANKHGFKVEISHLNICWEEACSIEKYLIQFWRDYGLFLANLTDGGEGVNGYKCTEEQRIKRVSYLNNPEVREKQKRSMSLPHVLKRQSEVQKKVHSNPELRKRLSEIQKKIHGTPEKRLQHKIISTNVFLREGYRETIKQKVKLAMNRPDVLKKFNRRVRQYDLNSNLLKEWDSIKSIKNELGFCKTYIINCCKNRRESYKNYKWQYVCERYS